MTAFGDPVPGWETTGPTRNRTAMERSGIAAGELEALAAKEQKDYAVKTNNGNSRLRINHVAATPLRR